MTVPVSFVSERFNDNTVKPNGEPESAGYRLAVTTLTAANYVAQKALIDNLTGAIADISIGVPAKITVVMDEHVYSVNPATSSLAQRENKFLCRYHAVSTHKKFTASIPCADLTTLPDHSEFLDMTADPALAIKTAWELIVRSPDDSGEFTILDSIQFVGRNT